MRKSMLTALCVLTGFVLLQGCETAKGMAKGVSQDIDNTSKNVGKLMNTIKETDDSFTEKYW